jgi:hypothetical protein
VLQTMSDSPVRVRGSVDTTARRITLTPRDSATAEVEPGYHPDGGDGLRLAGTVGGESVHVRLRRVDHTRFTLIAHGRQFRWVQDDNFNR